MSRIHTDDGLALASRWDDAVEPARGVVAFCHPHPLDGGSMTNPLMRKVTAVLVEAGLHVVRFDFRGVGESEGSWDEGHGEQRDVEAAVEAARMAFPDLPLGIAGWSFGASVSLRWQQDSGSRLPWVGIAPGIRSYRGSEPPEPSGFEPAPRLIVLGDRDQFASVEQMQDFADRLGARLEVLEGSDHFFVFRERVVGILAATHLGGRDLSEEG